MNYLHILFAWLGGTAGYFACGFALFAALPAMKAEFMKYSSVYRSEGEMMKMMPYGMGAILAAILVMTILYAMIGPARAGNLAGIYFGALIGVFSVCTFAIHNHVNLNIGLKLTLYQSVAYFFQWLVVGAVIGLIY